MADVEKKTESAEKKVVQKTPEAVQEGGVIASQPEQDAYGQAFALDHMGDRTLSEPDLIAMEEGETVAEYKARVAKIQANRFGFFDSAAEAKEQGPILIAQGNVGEKASPGVQDGKHVITGDVVNGVWNISVGTAEAINRHWNTVQIPQGAHMDYLSGIIRNPEKYEEYFQKYALNKSACDAAYKAFRLDRFDVDPSLIAGIIWNEQLHRKPTDAVQDLSVWLGKPAEGRDSIGPAQMQIRNIEALVKKYPDLKVLGDPQKAALDPAKAPFFVAAYLANEADNIEQYNADHSTYAGFQNIPVNTETLAYRYNPDVYRDHGVFRSLQPWEKIAVKTGMLDGVIQQEWPLEGVVQTSHHVRKVAQALKEVKTHR